MAVVAAGRRQAAPLAGRVTTGVDRATGGARGDTDCLGTGTAMAALIVAQPVKGSAVAGIAPDAAVMPVWVAGRTPGASTAASVAGIRAAVGSGASVVALGPQVDLGQAEVVSAVNEAVDDGVVVVVGAAAGRPPRTPTCRCSTTRCCASSGGAGPDGQADSYRSGGVDMVAPSIDVTSLGITGARPVNGAGTHLAVAYVAGQAALIRSAYPDLDPAQVRNRVLKTAKTTGGVAPEIDLTASVTAVLPEEAPRAQAAAQASGSAGIGRRAALLTLAGPAALAALLLGLRARRSARTGAGRPEAAPAGTGTAAPSVPTVTADAAATRTDPAVAAPPRPIRPSPPRT